MFAIFKPGGQSQSPKLRLAIKTLKIAALEPSVGSSGVVHKAGQLKSKLSQAYKKHQAAVDGPGARFDINKLAEQIDLECVWRDDKSGDPKRWGGVQENDRSYCAGLINRVEEIVHAPEMACVMQPGALRSFGEALDEFFKDGEVRTLRVSMQHVPFAHSAREIVANTIGRHLLALGRTGAYKSKPLLVVVDEAHQFFGKSIGDEYTRCTLDAFELIAKEGRKYALTLCIATQRPRDITEDVLSQMGTLIVHRLVNDSDREVVERATSSLDASASGFLPSLGQGEALIVGAAFTVPLMVQMMAPTEPPESRGPDYQTHWKIVPA